MLAETKSVGVAAILLLVGACGPSGYDGAEPDLYVLAGPAHYVDGYPAQNDDGTVNVVVEIPTGTTAKWEVDKVDGVIRWEQVDGVPRIVDYLGYPGNYGMVPRTLLPSDDGGDGDPLDVLVLGDAVERGTVVAARLVGVLRLRDRGEVDDKLIAVPAGSALAAEDLAALRPGVLEIIETWFTNYKGPDLVVSAGFGNAADALEILEAAGGAYDRRVR